MLVANVTRQIDSAKYQSTIIVVSRQCLTTIVSVDIKPCAKGQSLVLESISYRLILFGTMNQLYLV